MMRAGLMCIALLAGVLWLSGCAMRSPPVEFYTLSPLESSADEKTSTVAPELRALAIGPLVMPRYLDRDSIVTRANQNRLQINEYQRWSSSLESDFLKTLGNNLGRLLDTQRIVVYPATPRFPIRYRITFEVQQFEGTLGEQVTLDVRWLVTDAESDQVVAIERSVINQAVENSSYDALVAAHSATLATLSQAIAARVLTLAQTPPAVHLQQE